MSRVAVLPVPSAGKLGADYSGADSRCSHSLRLVGHYAIVSFPSPNSSTGRDF